MPTVIDVWTWELHSLSLLTHTHTPFCALQVKTWFQNRRTKWKKQMNDLDRAEREQEAATRDPTPTSKETSSDEESDSQNA